MPKSFSNRNKTRLGVRLARIPSLRGIFFPKGFNKISKYQETIERKKLKKTAEKLKRDELKAAKELQKTLKRLKQKSSNNGAGLPKRRSKEDYLQFNYHPILPEPEGGTGNKIRPPKKIGPGRKR